MRSKRSSQQNFGRRFGGLIFVSVIAMTGCSVLEGPRSDAFLVDTPAPRLQEFRWSNGRSPQTIDPARVSAAPETDVIRAIYEGMTELDPRTLEAIPAAAESWSASADSREWTFKLRTDAKWSNGDSVTASDFVRSWTRAAKLPEPSPHASLFGNIIGLKRTDGKTGTVEPSRSVSALTSFALQPGLLATGTPNSNTENSKSILSEPTKPIEEVGLTAVDDRTIMVRLVEPNREFPRLAAHPIFRPIYGGEVTVSGIPANVVTNGAFGIAAAGPGSITLERSETYWNKAAVKLDRIVFVPTEAGEQAIEAYRAGKVDVVTNAQFSPLAIKLLAQYDDFRRRPFAALNLYDLNVDRPAFQDRRVREALAISVERERLTDGELEGTTQPAYNYLPFGSSPKRKLVQDRQRARDLMQEAGYPNGEDFPAVKLTVNRNDAQQRIARSVAQMWKQILNIDVEVIVKEAAEIERDRTAGDFDIARRGVVMPTSDEASNMRKLFGSKYQSVEPQDELAASNSNIDSPEDQASNTAADVPANLVTNANAITPSMPTAERVMVNDEDDALFELTSIPLYFASSYSLVKPYVVGFDTNGLDSPLLLEVYINPNWRSGR